MRRLATAAAATLVLAGCAHQPITLPEPNPDHGAQAPAAAPIARATIKLSYKGTDDRPVYMAGVANVTYFAEPGKVATVTDEHGNTTESTATINLLANVGYNINLDFLPGTTSAGLIAELHGDAGEIVIARVVLPDGSAAPGIVGAQMCTVPTNGGFCRIGLFVPLPKGATR